MVYSLVQQHFFLSLLKLFMHFSLSANWIVISFEGKDHFLYPSPVPINYLIIWHCMLMFKNSENKKYIHKKESKITLTPTSPGQNNGHSFGMQPSE